RISGITTTIDKSARRFTFDLAVAYCLDDATTDHESPVPCMLSIWRVRMCDELAGLVAEHLQSYPAFGEDITPRSMSLRGDLLLRVVKRGFTAKLADLYDWNECTASSHRKAVVLIRDRRIGGVLLLSARRLLVFHDSGATIYTFGDSTDTTDLQDRTIVDRATATWTFAFWQPVTHDTTMISPEMPMSRSSTDPTVVSVYAHRSVYVFHIPQNTSEEVTVMETRTGDYPAYSFVLVGLQCCVWWHRLPTLSTLKFANFTRSLAAIRTSKVADGLVVAEWCLKEQAGASSQSHFDEPSGRLLIQSWNDDRNRSDYIILDC
ncbi:hypothetical protein FRB99_003280, partial [Tulasnella sp. 403]